MIFDNEKVVELDRKALDDIDLAYAMTIHKSQGSEFKVVVLPIWWGPPMLMTRNLIYTAITRAKNVVVMVGNRSALKRMIDNDLISERYSKLRASYLQIEEWASSSDKRGRRWFSGTTRRSDRTFSEIDPSWSGW